MRAAPRIGDFIKANLPLPELVLCSSAVRARTTFELLIATWPKPVPVEFDRGIYLASPDAILKRLALLPNSIERAMVIGHNPSLHRLAVKLTFGGDREAMDDLRTRFPTAALAVLEFDGNGWVSMPLTSGRLIHFVLPRMLAKG